LAEKKAEESSEDVVKNPRLMLFNLLRALKFFYSFRDLERLLEVPAQVLWRYAVLRAVPEKDTAQKILARIREKLLVEETIKAAVKSSSEPWMLLANPGMLMLAALKAVDEFKKSRIEVVLASPDPYSASLAAIVASYIGARLCTSSCTPLSSNTTTVAYEVAPGIVRVAALPRKCLSKKAKTLIVASSVPPEYLLTAPLELAYKSQADVAGFFILAGNPGVARNLMQRYTHLTTPPKTVVLVERG
jgi:hypothetical protein